jgi:hypothetical protein
VPLLLQALQHHSLSQSAGDGEYVEKQRIRAGVLRLVHAALTCYRARDKLSAEQTRLFLEFRAAQALAGKARSTESAERATTPAAEDRGWDRMSESMAASRTENGLFVYGCHGVLVLGSSRNATFTAINDDMEANTAIPTKKSGAADKGKGKVEVQSEDVFAARRGGLHPVECWYGGPLAETTLLAASPNKLPSVHGLDRLVTVGAGYSAFGSASCALVVWQSAAAAEVALDAQTSRDKAAGKPNTASGKRSVAVSVAEVPEPNEDRTILLSEQSVVPSRLWIPSVTTAAMASRCWLQAADPLATPDTGVVIKSAFLPVDDATRCCLQSIVNDVRGFDPSTPLAQLGPACSEMFMSGIYGHASLCVSRTLHSLASYVADAGITNGK